MPVDCFCKIDGISGESTDSAHAGEIEVLSYGLGFTQAAMVSTSGVGGSTGQRADLSEFSIVKLLDTSSPVLMKYCCTGKHIPTVTISVNGANESKAEYMNYVLSDVVVSSVNATGPSGSHHRPEESIGFRYGKIQVTYTPYDKTGKKGSAVKAGWDTSSNKAL
jgi:type VI secretion system secreted protein Hcp